VAHRNVLVIGASGDVGQGIVRAALHEGWSVVAAARKVERLSERLGEPGGNLVLCAGDISTEAGATALWDSALAAAGRIDAVVVSVNAPVRVAPLAQWSAQDLAELLAANLQTHFIAAQAMLPRLPENGVFIGIGGGTADVVLPGLAPLSVVQAGLRMLYRGAARELTGSVQLRELIINSMVNGPDKRVTARPEWLTDDEVGAHVCAILADPAAYPGPILQLRSRDQVGKPEHPAPKG
jgi:NAD(P)-dependent dehydrogenase (short-subunit alcohol dehydrogenase family)